MSASVGPTSDGDATVQGSTLRHAPPSRALVLASTVIAALAAAAAAVGLLVPDFYRDAPTLVSQARGQDLLTLAVAVPALLASVVAARRGSLRGYLVWLGVLGYLLYTYASYAFMTTFNPLYLAYVALLALSLGAFVAGILRLDATQVKRALDGRRLRAVVAFEILVVALVGFAWLAEIVPATLSRTTPASAADANIPVNVIHSLDLGVLLPGFVVAAYWLHHRRPWGYALAVVLLAKVATLGAAILSMVVVMAADGAPAPFEQVVVFGALTVASVALLARLLGSMTAGESAGDAAGGGEHGGHEDRSVDAS
ncbi:hypothetical protein [Halorubellus salinus]|uniref:hypothetical protein n=1 Tax=Halorubellus salinus TaxID=755309 RepID=UPI001D07960A|nr:hypothetical protein [Halorubellus salinus]